MLRRHRTLAGAVALGGLLLPPLALAQTGDAAPLNTVAVSEAPAPAAPAAAAADRGNRLIEEIVVTAQKREENLQDVPLSVQAFSAERLDAAGALNAQDLPRITPGMTVTAQVGYSTTFLRGVGSDAFLLADPSVVTYIDGVYNPFALGQFSDFGDVERIEVLKGPQGTLFGRNAIGGAVNILTKRPSLERSEVSLQTIYGSYDAYKTRAYLSVPLSDTLAVAVAGVYNSADHHIDGRIAGNPLPREIGKGARIKLLYAPSEDLELQLNALRSEQSGVGTVYSPNTTPSTLGTLVGIQPQDPYGGAVSENIYNNIDNTTLSGQIRVGTPWLDFKLLASDQYITVFQPYDVDGSPLPIAALVADPGLSDAQTAELQILSNEDSWGADWLQWIVGAYYFKSEQGFDPAYLRAAGSDLANGILFGVQLPANLREAILGSLGNLPVPSGTVNIVGLVGTESIAYFTQATVDITDTFALTLGLRAQEEEREIIESSSGVRFLDGSVVPIPGQNYSARSDPQFRDTTRSVDPKVSLSYRPEWDWLGDETLLFVSWQTAKKSSTFNVLNIYDRPEYVKPEDIEAYEAGIKTRLFDGLLSVNAAVFRYTIDNQQVQLVSLLAGGAVQFENAGSSRTVGFDVDAVALLFPDWIDDLTLSGGAAILDAKYTSYPNASGFDQTTGLLVSGNDYSGNQVVRSPDLSGNLTLVKTFHAPRGPIEIGVDYYYNSGFYYLAQGTPNVEEDAYATLGARLSYKHEPWQLRVTLYGLNLTDEEYNYGRFPIDFGTHDARAPKSNYGLRLNWEF